MDDRTPRQGETEAGSVRRTCDSRVAILAVTGEIRVVSLAWHSSVTGFDGSLGLCRYGPSGNFLVSIEESVIRSMDAWKLLAGVRNVLEGRRRAFTCECRRCIPPDHAVPPGYEPAVRVSIRAFDVHGAVHARVVLHEILLATPVERRAIA